MLVFAVVLPDIKSNPKCPHNYAVVENNNHQLPIGTVSFSSVKRIVMTNSQDARSRLNALEKKLEIQQRMTKDNEIKLKILKFIFKGHDGFEQASALYTKHCDVKMVSELTDEVQTAYFLRAKERKMERKSLSSYKEMLSSKENKMNKGKDDDDKSTGNVETKYEGKVKDKCEEEEEESILIDPTKFARFVSCIDQGKMGSGSLSYLSCREISHYFWKCPNSEREDRRYVVDFFFPSLPPPLTIIERDSIGSGSSLCFEAAHADVCRTKNDVENARKNLKSSLQNKQP